MAKGASGLPGFRDFFPEEFATRAHILGTWREVARRFGFVEYDGPPLEPLELYTKKSGDEIVGQLYNFRDKGDREVALRPEMTPTFARMVASKANALRKPVRWFSIPQLFRYERQQKGRLREHFQLNVDIVGETDLSADAELLAVAVECMRAFGLGPADVRVRLSDRRLLVALLKSKRVPDDLLPAVYGVIDKLDRQPEEVSREKLADIGVRGEVQDFILALRTAGTIESGDAEVTALSADVKRLQDFASALGIGEWIDVDLTIVRGLAYYTGTVFELFDARGEFRAICGGGRYDNLLGQLGGVELPALGFGMGDVVLGELLKARGLAPSTAPAIDVWVAYENAEDIGKAMQIVTRERRAGKSVEYALRPMQLGKQLKAAGAAGARAAIILRADGSAVRKDLASGAEEGLTFPHG
jgi:histidyl-tRNA synthetase